MQFSHSGNAPVYAPNSYGRSYQDEQGPVDNGWESDGSLVRSAYELHAEDDDFGQAHTLIREVMDEAARGRLVETVTGALLGGVEEPVLSNVFQYWKNIDQEVGENIEKAYRARNRRPGARRNPHRQVAHCEGGRSLCGVGRLLRRRGVALQHANALQLTVRVDREHDAEQADDPRDGAAGMARQERLDPPQQSDRAVCPPNTRPTSSSSAGAIMTRQ